MPKVTSLRDRALGRSCSQTISQVVRQEEYKRPKTQLVAEVTARRVHIAQDFRTTNFRGA